MHKKSVVRLSEEERMVCEGIIKHLKGSSQKFRRAQSLLKADAEGAGGRMSRLPRPSTAACTRSSNGKRLVTERFALALDGKKRQEPPTPCKRDGEADAKRIARRLGKPPAGYGHWTLHLLADAMVALAVVEAISHETVRRTLTKMA